LEILTSSHHGNHLVQHVVGVALRDADVHCLQAGAHARDGAVVVAALDVDGLVEAALELLDVVSHVRHEIGIGAVGLAHHAVLVVAVIGGLQPQGAVLLVGDAGVDQRLHGGFDLAVAVERGLQIIIVELDAEGLQVLVLLVAQVGDGEAADRFDVVHIAGGGGRLAVAGRDGFLRQEVVGDVLDVVAVVGRLGPLGVARLEAAGARLHRGRQGGDLDAGVVVVELAGDLVALGFEQRGHGIAQRGLAAVADVQRAGRVGRDEFDDHMMAGAGIAAAVGLALLQDGARHRLLGGVGQAQVDEARTRDLGRGDQALGLRIGLQGGDQAGGQLARIGLQRLGQLHRDIAGDVAVGRVARALERDVRNQIGAGNDRGQGGLEQGNDFLFLLGEHWTVVENEIIGGPLIILV
jgi:hypothetical protein